MDWEKIKAWTATHELGHAVVSELGGCRVKEVVLETFQTGYTDVEELSLPPEMDADDRVAAMMHRGATGLAGHVAVSLLCGEADAARQLRMTDEEHLASDTAKTTMSAEYISELNGEIVDEIKGQMQVLAVDLLQPETVSDAFMVLLDELLAKDRLPGERVREVLGVEPDAPE